mgnify:CR=1 FL=1
MSDATTKVMLAAYEQDAEPTMFLSGMFQSPPRNFHNSEEVEIDIVRSDEEISIAIQDLSTGARHNSNDLYTNKAFKPPIHKEKGPINAHNLIKRQPGSDPFQAVDFQANAITQGMDLGRKLQRKILRAIEQQSSQVLTTGTVTLVNGDGDATAAEGDAGTWASTCVTCHDPANAGVDPASYGGLHHNNNGSVAYDASACTDCHANADHVKIGRAHV